MTPAQRKTVLADKLSQHGAHIYQCALRLIGQHDLAEDIVQETYLKLFRSTRIDLSAIRNWPAYLKCMATSLAYDLLRKRMRQPIADVDFYTDQIIDESESTQDRQTPERQLLNRERLSALQQALSQLTRKDCQVFVLRFVEEFSYAEIADQLKISTNLVGVSLHRAQKKIIQQLKTQDTGDCYVTP